MEDIKEERLVKVGNLSKEHKMRLQLANSQNFSLFIFKKKKKNCVNESFGMVGKKKQKEQKTVLAIKNKTIRTI